MDKPFTDNVNKASPLFEQVSAFIEELAKEQPFFKD